MKKVLCIFAVALAFVACGKKATTETTTEPVVESVVVEEVVADSALVVEEAVEGVVAK